MSDSEKLILQTVATYDRIAPRYSKHWLSEDVTEDGLKRFLDYLPQKGLVVDIGCGIGRDVRFLVDQGVPTLGVDISVGMLKEAKRVVPDGRFVLMDMRNLGLPDKSVDGIWACASVLHIPKHLIEQVLRGFHRILKRNGVLFLSMQEGDSQELFVEREGRIFAYYKREDLRAFLEKNRFRVFDFQSNVSSRSTFNKALTVTSINYWAKKP
jgi:ubiquinone/menaquinone biosynthesis C-methylase UbiE